MAPHKESSAILADELAPLHDALADRFRFERELGRGGFGVVYLVRDLSAGTELALKVLPAHLISTASRRRFQQEIAYARRLDHPRIIPILESGEVDAQPFFTMPYVRGSTLAQRIKSDGALSIEEAVRMALDVAEALGHAHGRNIVHRDVKPSNIIVTNDGARVLDFGIARAIHEVPVGGIITKTGMQPGTATYMSPEQSSASPREIDGRADIYSLGCVLYEMLSGGPPFTGPTDHAVVARHAMDPVPPLSTVRRNVPPGIEAVVVKALEKVPADRFQTAEEFAKALTDGAAGAAVALSAKRRGGWRRLATWPVAAGALVVGVGVLYAARATHTFERLGLSAVRLDSTVVVVIPGDSASGGADLAERVRTSLASWRGLSVVDPFGVAEAVRKAGGGGVGPTERAHRIAASAQAGRYVLTRAEALHDSLELYAAIFDTRGDSLLGDARVRAVLGTSGATEAAGLIVDSLLFKGDYPRFARPERSAGTASLNARHAYLRAHAALEDGEFGRADSLFFAATRDDADYPQALTWLATLRWWVNSDDAPWEPLVQQAVRAAALRASLSSDDTFALGALEAQAAQRDDVACRAWARRTRGSAPDFAAWYSLGVCLRRDRAVVRDSLSPSGWNFRSSRESALRAYERAYRLRPALLHGLGARALTDLQDLFVTSVTKVRVGEGLRPDTTQFRAYPSWQRDTLSLVPYPRTQALLAAPPEAVALATQHERERLHAVARMWRAAYPHRADAAEAVAVSLELLGNPAALDSLHLARELSHSVSDALRIAGAEVLLRVKYAVPSDLISLRSAVRTADSLMAANPPSAGVEPRMLGSLAALTGHAELAAAYARAGGIGTVSPALAQNGPALVAYASLAGPADTLLAIEQRVLGDVASVPDAQRGAERTQWIGRSAALAWPDVVLGALRDKSLASTTPLIAAAAAHDTTAVLRILASVSSARRLMRPADVMLDGLLPESSALAAIGDARGAIAWIDPTLVALRSSASSDLAQIPRAAALVRAMALRATLAAEAGDAATAKRWAAAVEALWHDADDFLQPVVRRMKMLAR